MVRNDVDTNKKCNMYDVFMKHECDMENENELKHEYEHERQYVMNT